MKPPANKLATDVGSSGDDADNSPIGSDTAAYSIESQLGDVMDSDEQRADDLSFWFPDDDEPQVKAKRHRKGEVTTTPIANRPRLLITQRDFIFNKLPTVVDPTKYALLVNTLD